MSDMIEIKQEPIPSGKATYLELMQRQEEDVQLAKKRKTISNLYSPAENMNPTIRSRGRKRYDV